MAKAAAETEETTSTGTGDDGEKPVAQQIREMAETTNPATGKNYTRREIADAFGISYQRVFQVTKGLEVYKNGEGAGGGQRARVVVETNEALEKEGRSDLVGMSRVDAIRKLYEEYEAQGVEKPIGKIAKLLGCSYQIVFQATRAQRAAGEGDDTEGEDLEASGVEGDTADESDEDFDDEADEEGEEEE